MAEITLQIPSGVHANEAKLLLMIKLYELGRLSLGKAAELSGYSVAAFLEVLSQYGVSVIDYPPDELEREMSL